MSLLTCSTTCSLVEFARQHNVHHRHLWLPLHAALPTRAARGATVSVDAQTPIALLEDVTGTLTVDKRSICVRLHAANAMQCEEATVELDPAVQPPGHTVFVRWDRKGTKVLREGTRVLHYDGVPLSSRSSTAGAKRSRAAEDTSVDASTLADTLRGAQHRISLAQRSSEDLQRRLAAAVQQRATALHARSLHILTSTLANIRQRSQQPPLHFIAAPEAVAVEAGGVSWARANRRLLSRVFRGAGSVERSEASKYADGSRQLRFYFIEDVLLRRPLNWAAAEDGPAGDSECAAAAAGSSGDVELLLRDGVLADMNGYAERGYRIVWLEHYPVLHHGSRFTVEQTLAPIVRVYRECCPHLTVTVVLSAVSYVAAARRQGMELSFVVPQAGLLQFFLAEMNTSLQPDAKTSAVVGSRQRHSPYLSDLHCSFARHASLAYVDVADLQ